MGRHFTQRTACPKGPKSERALLGELIRVVCGWNLASGEGMASIKKEAGKRSRNKITTGRGAVTTRMDLVSLMLSEVSQVEMD